MSGSPVQFFARDSLRRVIDPGWSPVDELIAPGSVMADMSGSRICCRGDAIMAD